MNLDKFGRTLLFAFFFLLFLKGANMAIRFLVPYAENIDQSFGDVLRAVSD